MHFAVFLFSKNSSHVSLTSLGYHKKLLLVADIFSQDLLLIEAKTFQGNLHFNKNDRLLDFKELWGFRHSFQVEEELSVGLFYFLSKSTLIFLYE